MLYGYSHWWICTTFSRDMQTSFSLLWKEEVCVIEFPISALNPHETTLFPLMPPIFGPPVGFYQMFVPTVHLNVC
ncbi:hypothetical protein ABEB36_003293 [Hypothenemus hampei]|uniref:Uncharacterized protein n=1 Tax=Hypothenemus hampei TaxID=57062 RepID=A0ABD1F8N4_HYPHA